MNLFKRIVFWVSSVFCLSSYPAFAQKEKLHLRNAYEISKWLYKVEKGIYKPTSVEKDKIMGSLIWYANLQDDLGNFKQLDELLKKYSKLYALKNNILNEIISIDTFFRTELLPKNKALLEIKEPQLATQIVQLNNDYFTLQNNKREFEIIFNRFLSFFPVLKSEINERKFECDTILTRMKSEQSFLQDRLVTEPDTLKKESILKQIQTINQSIQGIEKSIESFKKQEQELNERFSAYQDQLSKKVHATDSTKKVIDSILSVNKEKLIGFFITLSGRADIYDTESTDKVYANAFNYLHNDADYNFQSNLYLQEAQKYQAFRLPSQNDAIEAVAIYLANRIKQESVLWFFETITNNAKNYDLIKTFFPNTIKLLQGNENYEVPNMGTQWRYSLSMDFMEMPRRVLTSPWLKNMKPELSQYEPYFKGALDMADLILKRYTYKDMIRTLYVSNQTITPYSRKSNESSFSFHDLITLLYAINSELYIPDSSAKFRPLSYEDFKNMTLYELEVMISLIDLKYNGIFSKLFKNVSTQFTLKDAAHADFLRQFLGSIEMMVTQVETLGTQFLAEQKRLQQGIEQNDIFFSTYNIWGTLTELLKVLNNDASATYLSDGIRSTKNIFGYVQQMFDVYNLLSKKNFSAAVLNTISLVEKIVYETGNNNKYAFKLDSLPEKFSNFFVLSDFKKVIKQLILARQKNDSVQIKNLEHQRDDIIKKWGFEYRIDKDSICFQQNSLLAALLFEKDRHALQLIRKLSGFLNDVSMAKDDKQLAKVVESYAMPVGSYKRKRNNWASLDINAFAGAYIGYENAIPQSNDPTGNPAIKNVKTGGVWGLSVPIGISYSTVLRKRIQSSQLADEFVQNPDRIRFSSKGHRFQLRRKSTVTFTASIIDLGAIVSYRLFNSSDKPLGQDLKWSQFISPGFHISLAIKNTPLVWNCGLQYTPQLRKFEEGGVVNDKQYNATRIYTGIFFDLPLFNLLERKHFKSYQ